MVFLSFFFFFFNDTATTEIYTLSLHDALPISPRKASAPVARAAFMSSPAMKSSFTASRVQPCMVDRKSTRLNSSHSQISYAVFCLKKKKTKVNVFRYYAITHDNISDYASIL